MGTGPTKSLRTPLRSLELARIGSQLFVYDSATRDQTATSPLFDTFATRLSAQPLNLEDRRTVLADAVKALPDELQKSVAAETTKALPDQLQKDIAAETAQILPGEVKRDAVVETVQSLATEAKKDVATEAAKALPDELQKSVAAEATESLPDEVKRDVVNKAVQGMPTVDRKDIATRAFQDLTAKDRQDVAGNPSQYVTDQIWLTIVRTFSAVLFFSAIGLLYVSIWPPQGESNPTQVMLPVFTSIAGILAGFIGGRASAGG